MAENKKYVELLWAEKPERGLRIFIISKYPDEK